MNLETFLLIIGIGFLVLFIISLPLVWQIWKTITGVKMALKTINETLPSILKNVAEMTGNINSSTTTINNEIQTISNGLNRFYSVTSGIVGDVRNFSPNAVKGSLFNLLGNGLAIIKGVRVFLDVFFSKK